MSKEPIILIVDDEKNTREGIRDYLQGDFDVYLASDAAAALQVLKNEAVDLMVTDLRLGKVDGMELIAQALALPKAPVCIMMTAYGSVDTAVEAMKQGAYDFVTKPVNMDRMELLIRRALREKNTQRENTELRQRIGQVVGIENMIGSSPAIVSIFDKIKQVASSRVTVLIEGESGTGKELAAHAIHQLSPRADEKFVAVHCAALSPQLLESELFGHERGAFTGATERRIGRFEQARGGTLFLDEIGEIDSSTQVKILRVLGEKNFERVGGNTTLQADVRLLAATNKNLEAMVQEGTFREDLYFRLNVVRITMPPLRDRREDIPLLVNSFLKSAAEENAKSFRPCAPEAMAAM
ncbi:MAG: sigma-54-dependent transcriptional regulator, partial [Chthoniobacterales bacterium]